MAKRDDILNAAERLFELRGFHAVPIDEITKAAGVSPRTLYAHFPSKSDLAAAVLDARHDRYIGHVMDLIDATPDPLDGLVDALESWLSHSRSNGCMFLRALGEFEGDVVARQSRKHKKKQRDVVSSVIERSRRDSSLVDPVIIAIEGATALAPSIGASAAVSAARTAIERMVK